MAWEKTPTLTTNTFCAGKSDFTDHILEKWYRFQCKTDKWLSESKSKPNLKYFIDALNIISVIQIAFMGFTRIKSHFYIKWNCIKHQSKADIFPFWIKRISANINVIELFFITVKTNFTILAFLKYVAKFEASSLTSLSNVPWYKTMTGKVQWTQGTILTFEMQQTIFHSKHLP